MKALHEVRLYDSNFMVWCSSYNDMSFLSHWHKEIELIFVRHGTAKISVSNQSFLAREGDLIICDSDNIHYSDSYQMTNQLDFIIFDPGVVHSVGQYSRFTSPIIPKKQLAEQGLSAVVDRLFSEIPRELQQKQPYYQDIIKGILRDFWYKAKRTFASDDTGGQNSKRSDIDHRLHELLSYLETHYQEDIPLTDAAQRMSFSECYFSRCFKKYTGINFAAYMNVLRVENAVHRLQNTADPVSQIALDCGFSNIRNFNRVFRQFTTYSPSDFRKLKSLGTYTMSFPNRKTPLQALVKNDSPVVINNRRKLDEADTE